MSLAMVLVCSYVASQTPLCKQILEKGISLYNSGKYPEAVTMFNKGLKLNCDDCQSWLKKCEEKTAAGQELKSEPQPQPEPKPEPQPEPKPQPALDAQPKPEPESKPQLLGTGSAAETKLGAPEKVIILPELEALVIYPSDLVRSNIDDAQKTCDTLNSKKTFGYDNWHIPSKSEMQSIHVLREKIRGIIENAQYLCIGENGQKTILNKSAETASIYLRPIHTAKVEVATTISAAESVAESVKPDAVQTAVPLEMSEGLEVIVKTIKDNPTSWWESGNIFKGEKDDNDLRNGLGIFYYHSTKDFYFGGFKNGERSGNGIYIREADAFCKCYIGEWSSNKKSGKGACYNNAGILNFYGDFTKGLMTGIHQPEYDGRKFEIINYPDGAKYLGETKDGKIHGYGIYVWTDGAIWYGEWKDGVRDGNGIEIKSDGAILTGQWKNNTQN
jgi:hypothetical protein